MQQTAILLKQTHRDTAVWNWKMWRITKNFSIQIVHRSVSLVKFSTQRGGFSRCSCITIKKWKLVVEADSFSYHSSSWNFLNQKYNSSGIKWATIWSNPFEKLRYHFNSTLSVTPSKNTFFWGLRRQLSNDLQNFISQILLNGIGQIMAHSISNVLYFQIMGEVLGWLKGGNFA